MIPCVVFKPGVALGDPPTSCQIRILAVLDHAARVMMLESLVTCGREAHPSTDPHTRGQALDIGIHGLTEEQILALYNSLTVELGGAFTVLYEVKEHTVGMLTKIEYLSLHATAPHIHVQSKIGTSWP